MKIKISKKVYACAIMVVCCSITVPCLAGSIEPASTLDTVHVNEIIQGETGVEIVTVVDKDGSFITDVVSNEPKTIKNCPHLQYRDVGRVSVVYRKVDSRQHKRGKRQPMQCVKCLKQSARYYGWKYLNHSFNKKNVCTFCNYKK